MKDYTWIEEKEQVKNAAKKAAEKGAKQEERLIRKGWRWVTINARTKLLVPCLKDGTPTEDGQKKIDQFKKMLNL